MSLENKFVGGVVGGISGLGIKLASSSAIPYAMSYYGVVVNGIGTYHTVGGVAATLQAVSVSPIVIPVYFLTGMIIYR